MESLPLHSQNPATEGNSNDSGKVIVQIPKWSSLFHCSFTTGLVIAFTRSGGATKSAGWWPCVSWTSLLLAAGIIHLIYIFFCIVFFYVKHANLADPDRSGDRRSRFIDAVYLALVSGATIGYGDIHPDDAATKAAYCIGVVFGAITTGLLMAFIREKIALAADVGDRYAS